MWWRLPFDSFRKWKTYIGTGFTYIIVSYNLRFDECKALRVKRTLQILLLTHFHIFVDSHKEGINWWLTQNCTKTFITLILIIKFSMHTEHIYHGYTLLFIYCTFCILSSDRYKYNNQNISQFSFFEFPCAPKSAVYLLWSIQHLQYIHIRAEIKRWYFQICVWNIMRLCYLRSFLNPFLTHTRAARAVLTSQLLRLFKCSKHSFLYTENTMQHPPHTRLRIVHDSHV